MKTEFWIAGIAGLIGIAGIVVCVLSLRAAFATERAAVISVRSEFRNDMVYVEPDGQQEPEVSEPSIFTVKKGDTLEGMGITIKSVRDDSLTFETYMDFYGDSSNQPGRVFTVKKGETLSLTMAGLYDATCRYQIEFIELANTNPGENK